MINEYQFGNVPEELKNVKSWIVWKGDKQPHSAITMRPTGWNKPENWTTFEDAVRVFEETECFSGIGFVFAYPYVGIDLDNCIDEHEMMDDFARNITTAMSTFTEYSISGKGLHLYCKVSEPLKSFKTAGLEVYPSGRFFVVTGNTLNDFQEKITDQTANLKRLISHQSKKFNFEIPPAPMDSPQKILEGSRNNSLFTFLSALRAKGFTEAELGAAGGTFNSRCTKPLPNEELQNIVKSVLKYAPGTRAAASEDFCDSPISFEEFKVPGFPVDALPSVIAEFVRAASHELQIPVDMAAVAALGVLSIPCIKRYKIEGKKNWHEGLNLYCVVVAEPAEKKSAILRRMIQPVEDFERQFNDIHAEEIARSGNARDILRKTHENWKMKAAKISGVKSREAVCSDWDTVEECAKNVDLNEECATERAAALAVELFNFKEVRRLRLVCDDTTPEKLECLLAENNEKMALVSSEGGIFNIMGGRYTPVENLDVFLKSHSGDTLRVDRINREGIFLASPTLSVLLTVQPEVLRKNMQNDTFRERGLLARFLYSIPKSPLGTRDPESPPIPPNIANAYDALLTKMLKKQTGVEHLLRLTPGASAASTAFARALEERLKPDGDLRSFNGWAGKIHGSTLRIAGILHVTECCTKDLNPEDCEVVEKTMVDAINIGVYFIEHATAAFSGADKPTEGAKRILKWLHKQAAGGKKEFRAREILRGNQRFKNMAALQPALDVLCERAFIKEIEQPHEQRRGRPINSVYILNPLAERFPEVPPTPLPEVISQQHQLDSQDSVPFAGPDTPALNDLDTSDGLITLSYDEETVDYLTALDLEFSIENGKIQLEGAPLSDKEKQFFQDEEEKKKIKSAGTPVGYFGHFSESKKRGE